MRTSRSNGTKTYSYLYTNGLLSRMILGDDTLCFAYDAVGAPLTVNYNGTTFYYVTNLQGDVIAILDRTGYPVVQYTYNAWGELLSATGSMANSLGALNPLLYRGYVYDRETGLYYLQSRYYNPEIGRFINADSYVSTGQGLLGNNMFAYCANNPVIYQDSSGHAIETVFDIISLGASIVDVAVNPWDPWAWLGLIGDAADVALLGVGGLGEAVRVLKAMGAIDETVDVLKVTKRTLEVISDIASALSVGENFVYLSYSNPSKTMLEYVGITNNFDVREAHHRLNGRQIDHYIDGVDRHTAHFAEQTIISLFGRNGSDLSYIRNSIGINNKSLNSRYREFFKGLF